MPRRSNRCPQSPPPPPGPLVYSLSVTVCACVQKLDAELKKRLAEEERQQRERERRQKEKEKGLERQRKEVERALREREKELARRSREQQRKDERARNTLRKDTMGDLRKARAEALVQVGQAYDQEEDEEELRRASLGVDSALLSPAGDATCCAGSLEELLLALPTFKSRYGVENGEEVDMVLDVVGILYSLKGLLKIGDDWSFDFFVHDVLGIPRTEGDSGGAEDEDNEEEGEGEGGTESNDEYFAKPEGFSVEDAASDQTASALPPESAGDMEEEPLAGEEGAAPSSDGGDMEVDGGVASKDLTCVEEGEEHPQERDASEGGSSSVGGDVVTAPAESAVEGSDRTTHRKRGRPRRIVSSGVAVAPRPQHSAVDLDRIQLNMIRVMLGNLHNLFGLCEKDSEASTKKKGKVSASSVTLPLNQLTWQELARMLIVLELNRDSDMSDDEVSGLGETYHQSSA